MSDNKKSPSKTRGILDSIFFIVMLLALIPQSTGIVVHEWLSFLILIPFALHLIINWNWITSNSKNLFKSKKQKNKFDYFFNWLLYVAMLVVTVSGIVISEAALPSLGINVEITPFWTKIHNVSASLLIVLLGVHIALHWKWIVKTYKKINFRTDFHHIKSIKSILQKNKKGFLILTIISLVISTVIWLIEFTNWAETINTTTQNKVNTGTKKLPKQWLIYVLPLVKVTVLSCIPALVTRLIIKIKKWLY